jgi:RimJ/RimL family protein N-acetyltransferase
MAVVGFANGLGATPESMAAWLDRLQADASRRHFVVHAASIGFCGEAYYAIDADHDLATLDIKLRPEAQGRGIASAALSQILAEIFDGDLAGRAYVDPTRHNAPALRLYERLGFVAATRPSWLQDPTPDALYLEITPQTFRRP